MALVACKVCKRFFINGVDEKEVCPDCEAVLNEIYSRVHGFLRDNEKEAYTAKDVSELLDIDLRYIEGLVSLGWVSTTGKAVAPPPQRGPVKIRPQRTQDETPAPVSVGKPADSTSTSTMHKYRKKKGDDNRK